MKVLHMKKFFLLASIVMLSIASFYLILRPVYSDELDDLTKKINDLQSSLDASLKATHPLESQLNSLKAQVANIEAQVAVI